MSTLDYCNATTQAGKLCKRKAICDSSKHGSNGEKYCKQHFTNYYDPSIKQGLIPGKFIVQKIERVVHDKDTGLPMRYVQGLNKKEKQLYKKEIEETNVYYKKTGLLKGRKNVRFELSKKNKTGKSISRSLTPYYSTKLKNVIKAKRSSYSKEFEKRYGFKATDLSKVKKLFPDTNVDSVLAKGRAAYASGSRPSMTGRGGQEAWSYSRLASVLVGGKALKVDKYFVGPKSLKIIFSKKYNK